MRVHFAVGFFMAHLLLAHFNWWSRPMTRWWFQTCFVFTPRIGEDTHFDYFSAGLKPPTSYDFKICEKDPKISKISFVSSLRGVCFISSTKMLVRQLKSTHWCWTSTDTGKKSHQLKPTTTTTTTTTTKNLTAFEVKTLFYIYCPRSEISGPGGECLQTVLWWSKLFRDVTRPKKPKR